jgi:probable rRNA maturation factor
VLSFDYGEGQGELIISVECAVRQVRRYRTTPRRELALYVIHGILHLHGYDDQTPNDRRRMRTAERRLMARLMVPPRPNYSK